MRDDVSHWDDSLASLEALVRSGNRDSALDEFLSFDAELTRYVTGEERMFAVLDRFASLPPDATARMRAEHRGLRRLVDRVGELIARAERTLGLEALASLRSVLMLHVAKEESVLQSFMRPVVP